MRKVICILITLLILLSFSTQIAFAEKSYVVDDASLFTDEEREKLDSYASDFSTYYSTDFVIITCPDLNGITPAEFADDCYNANEYSQDTVLLLISSDDGVEYTGYIKTTGSAADLFIYQVTAFEKIITSYTEKNNFYDAGRAFLYYTDKTMSGVLSKGSYVVDDANLLTNYEFECLYYLAADLSESYNMDFVIVTSPDFKGKTSEAYADDYYDYNGYASDGILLLLGTDNRAEYKNHISTTGLAIDLYRYQITALQSVVKSYIGSGDYYNAATEFLNYAGKVASGEITDKDAEKAEFNTQNVLKTVGICLIIGLIISLIIILIMKSKMKNVRFAKNATDYIVDGSYKINDINRIFAYATVTKTAIPKNNSSSHTGSSGTSHGGGSF